MLLSRCENSLWVAVQMGHKDWGKLGKFMGGGFRNLPYLLLKEKQMHTQVHHKTDGFLE